MKIEKILNFYEIDSMKLLIQEKSCLYFYQANPTYIRRKILLFNSISRLMKHRHKALKNEFSNTANILPRLSIL